MHSTLKLDEHRLRIFHEGRKRRIFVGDLFYDQNKEVYVLEYDEHYANSKIAIALGPTLGLIQLRHESEKGKMFPIFLDRIPDRENPAYKDYCEFTGISINEKNPIRLLTTIGKRGPSTFIFEAVYKNDFGAAEIIKFREVLQITQYDLAAAFEISKPTLQRIESGASHDPNTLKRLQILLDFPEVALWQLKQSGGYVHRDVLSKLNRYFAKGAGT